MAEESKSKVGLWVITVLLILVAAWVYFKK
jgi:hypothetical protein